MKGHTLPGIKQKTSPAKKELVGGQHNLPAELKAKIEAAPTKMYGKESPAKKSPYKYAQFIPAALSVVSSLTKKDKK
mgnify:CR=1 FL=1